MICAEIRVWIEEIYDSEAVRQEGGDFTVEISI